MHPGPKATRGQRRQTAARSDIKKTLAPQIFNFQHSLNTFFSFCDLLVVKRQQETLPVLTELKAFVLFGLQFTNAGHYLPLPTSIISATSCSHMFITLATLKRSV